MSGTVLKTMIVSNAFFVSITQFNKRTAWLLDFFHIFTQPIKFYTFYYVLKSTE